MLVVAGAGSGKTRVLTYRVAHLIRDLGVAPWEVLAITFTNKAAGEMKERVGRLVGPMSKGMWISTFHSACVRILRREAPRAGLLVTVHDLRRPGLAPGHQPGGPRSAPGSEEVPAPSDTSQDFQCQERVGRLRELPGTGGGTSGTRSRLISTGSTRSSS